jgi:hypothetical protein
MSVETQRSSTTELPAEPQMIKVSEAEELIQIAISGMRHAVYGSLTPLNVGIQFILRDSTLSEKTRKRLEAMLAHLQTCERRMTHTKSADLSASNLRGKNNLQIEELFNPDFGKEE